MATAVSTAQIPAAPITRRLARDEWVARGGLVALALWLTVTVALPLWALLAKSFQNRDGAFIGLANYATYLSNPALSSSIWNSLFVAVLATAVTIPVAFLYAYALTRSSMKATAPETTSQAA